MAQTGHASSVVILLLSLQFGVLRLATLTRKKDISFVLSSAKMSLVERSQPEETEAKKVVRLKSTSSRQHHAQTAPCSTFCGVLLQAEVSFSWQGTPQCLHLKACFQLVLLFSLHIQNANLSKETQNQYHSYMQKVVTEIEFRGFWSRSHYPVFVRHMQAQASTFSYVI